VVVMVGVGRRFVANCIQALMLVAHQPAVCEHPQLKIFFLFFTEFKIKLNNN
jgi:hypothetical protein